MNYYRLYLLNAANHFSGVIELICETDRDAISQAGPSSDGGAMELWQLGRLVKVFPATTLAT